MAAEPAEAVAQLGEQSCRAGRVGPGDDDRHEMPERRVPELVTPRELTRQEPRDVVLGCVEQRRRLRLEALDEHQARTRRGRSGPRAA